MNDKRTNQRIRIGSNGGCRTIRRTVVVSQAKPHTTVGTAVVYGLAVQVVLDVRGGYWVIR